MLTEDPTLHQNPGGSLLRNRTLLRKQTWSREQLFMDVSHNTISRKYKDPCSTVSGPRNGVPCKFPFKYNGKEYYKCTNMEIKGRQFQDYCATKLKNGNEIAGIGKCGPNCPRECLTSPNQPNGGLEANKPCIFPFKNPVDGKEYNGCDDIGAYKNVCATQVDSRSGNTRKIGVCGNGCPRHGDQTASTTTTTSPNNQKLTRGNYKEFKRTISKEDGRYLFGDGRDACGRPASKFQNNLKLN